MTRNSSLIEHDEGMMQDERLQGSAASRMHLAELDAPSEGSVGHSSLRMKSLPALKWLKIGIGRPSRASDLAILCGFGPQTHGSHVESKKDPGGSPCQTLSCLPDLSHTRSFSRDTCPSPR